MNMPVDPATLAASATPDKRDSHQPSQRMIGRLVLCNGSRAVISSAATSLANSNTDSWAIGRLIAISTATGRIIGVVYEMSTTSELWSDQTANVIYVKVELVGEIVQGPDGGSSFRSGITTYPELGAIAHRIRHNDLRAMYASKGGTSIEIGTLSQDETIIAAIDVDMMLSRHFAVVGTTGVGKSTSVSILLRRAVEAKPNLRVLVLDPHNEYASAFSDISVIVNSSTLELPFWMFRLDEFGDILFRGRNPDDVEENILRELIAAAKVRYCNPPAAGTASALVKRPAATEGAGITADTPVPYRMSDLMKLIDDEIGKLESKHPRASLRTVLNRLTSLTQDPRFKFMFARTTIEDNIDGIIRQIFRIPIDDRPITVFQLAGLPSEVVNSVASVMARMSFDLAMMSEGTYEILLLCEEAHRYVPQDKSLGFAPTRTSIARIAKEGRKYGCYLGVVTQRPGELDPTILSQCSTVFAMRLANERDQDIIRSALSDSSASTISFLSSIGNREAIAFGEAVGTPMRIKFVTQQRDHMPKTGSSTPGVENRAVKRDVDLRAIVGRMRSR